MSRTADADQLLAVLQEEPWHTPHYTRALTAQHLDGKQAERDTATLTLPELLLKTGAMTGPHRRTTPITRWRLIGRRISTALAALARAL